jgi:catechol 2,3-dioxygenase-like lactoylglutathione lyase family enzyme
MAIIPTVRSTDMARSVAFYTGVLDFEVVGVWPTTGDPAFAELTRGGDRLQLSSHSGDGLVGQAVAIEVDEVDELFSTYRARGLDVAARAESPVHRAPLDQSWGTREFYVDDPDGNVLRFIRR